MFTNALSHERMTPLNSILNLSTLVKKKCSEFLNEVSDAISPRPISENSDFL